MKKVLKRHGLPEKVTMDGLRSYCAAMNELGNAEKQEVGRWANNRVEDSHLLAIWRIIAVSPCASSASSGLYVWEVQRDGRELKVKVRGQLVLDHVDLAIDAAVAGRGVAFMIQDHVALQVADGSLVRVLEDWCEPFDGHYLYYPSRCQPSPTFSLLLEALQHRGER